MKIFDKWRNTDLSLKETKLRNIGKTEKLYLFENAVNHILTTDPTNIPDLLKEILGLSETSCNAFYRYSFGYIKSLFISNYISRETSYFIIICYLKYIKHSSEEELSSQTKIITEDINQWIAKIIPNSNYPKILLDEYINEIQIFGNSIIFNCNHHMKHFVIKLEKLTYYNQRERSLKYTKKKQNDIYNNNDGLCLGLAKHWLSSRASADLLTVKNNARQNARQQYVYELYRENFDYIKPQIRFLNKSIISGFTLKNNLLGSFYIKKNTFKVTLISISQHMQKYNLTNTYMLILTTTHAVGISISQKGNGLKFIFYDPNSPDLYSKIFLHSNQLESADLDNSFAPYLNNISTNNQVDPVLLVKIYTNSIDNPVLINNINNIDFRGDIIATNIIEQTQQLLFLAIQNSDYELIKNILDNNKDEQLLYSNNYQTTPIHLAIKLHVAIRKQSDRKILELFAQYIRKNNIVIEDIIDNNENPISLINSLKTTNSFKQELIYIFKA